LRKVEKLAIFDLDDTLYQGNSHFEILNEYYHTRVFTGIFIRALGKLFPAFRLRLINIFYEHIPIEQRQKFLLPYRQDVLQLLCAKQAEGYEAIIVSNAPKDLLLSAAQDLGLQYISARAHEKAKTICNEIKYNHLFVCTDNKTDTDLLNIADEAVITCKNKHKEYFVKKLKNTDVKYKFMCP